MDQIVEILLTAEFAVAFTMSVGAGLMRGFSGFGSSMMMAPVFAILYGPYQAVTMILALEVLVSLQLLPRALKGVDWSFVAPLSLAGCLAMPFGNWVLRRADPELMTRGMAGLVLVFSLIVLTGWRYHGRKTLAPTVVVGALSGALIGSSGMGGPPILLYVLAGTDSADANRSNVIIYFAIAGLMLFAVMTWSGLATAQAYLTALALLPGFVFFTWVGARLFDKSSERLYRTVALVFLCAVGIYGLAR